MFQQMLWATINYCRVLTGCTSVYVTAFPDGCTMNVIYCHYSLSFILEYQKCPLKSEPRARLAYHDAYNFPPIRIYALYPTLKKTFWYMSQCFFVYTITTKGPNVVKEFSKYDPFQWFSILNSRTYFSAHFHVFLRYSVQIMKLFLSKQPKIWFRSNKEGKINQNMQIKCLRKWCWNYNGLKQNDDTWIYLFI